MTDGEYNLHSIVESFLTSYVMALIELFFKLSDKHLRMLNVWRFVLCDSDRNMLSKFGVNLKFWLPSYWYNLNLIEFEFKPMTVAILKVINSKLIRKYILKYRFDFLEIF